MVTESKVLNIAVVHVPVTQVDVQGSIWHHAGVRKLVVQGLRAKIASRHPVLANLSLGFIEDRLVVSYDDRLDVVTVEVKGFDVKVLVDGVR